MIRDEFAKLWNSDKRLGGPVAQNTDRGLRLELATRSPATQPGGTKGFVRPAEAVLGLGYAWPLRAGANGCLAPHADMYASRYLVVEWVNNQKVIERGRGERPLTPEERKKIKDYLSGPLGVVKTGKKRSAQANGFGDRPARTYGVGPRRQDLAVPLQDRRQR